MRGRSHVFFAVILFSLASFRQLSNNALICPTSRPCTTWCCWEPLQKHILLNA